MMKRFWLLFIMMTASAVGMAQTTVQVDLNDSYVGGTITVKSNEAQTDGSALVTLTVMPETGYYIAKDDITVVLTIDAEETGTRSPVVGATVELAGDDPADLSQPRDYTFTVPAGLNAWVREAVFHSSLNISGDDSSEVTWTFDAETKVLSITGHGITYDFGIEGNVDPWASVRSQIASVEIGSEVTGLGNRIFAGCTSLTTIKIANDEQVLAIGTDAIPANEGLTVDVPGNLYNEYQTTAGWQSQTITSESGIEMTGVALGDNNQYDTFVSLTDNVKVPSVLKAYTVTGINGSELVLTEVSVIPAGVPVLVFSPTLKSSDFRTAATTGEASGQSLLKVAPEGGKTVALGEVYLLYNDVFYYARAGVIPAGGVYLQPETQSGTRAYYALTRGIGGDGDGTTAIDLQPVGGAEAPSAWYGLDGQRLSTMPTRKGIYVKDGKKVIIR